jgi:hypothetical protein
MVDAAREEERDPVDIGPPDQSPDAEGRSVRGDYVQPHYSAGPKSSAGKDFCTMIADVRDLARIATSPGFDKHGPYDASSRMLPPISDKLGDHALTGRQSMCRAGIPRYEAIPAFLIHSSCQPFDTVAPRTVLIAGCRITSKWNLRRRHGSAGRGSFGRADRSDAWWFGVLFSGARSRDHSNPNSIRVSLSRRSAEGF